MTDPENNVMAFVRDEPEEAARELADLREAFKHTLFGMAVSFIVGVLVGALVF